MAYSKSLTLIVPVADVEAANAYFESIGWGAPVLTIQLSANGQLPITHIGAHSFDTPEKVATLEAAKASSDPLLDGINNLFIKAVTSDDQQFQATIGSDEVAAAFGSTLSIYHPPSDI